MLDSWRNNSRKKFKKIYLIFTSEYNESYARELRVLCNVHCAIIRNKNRRYINFDSNCVINFSDFYLSNLLGIVFDSSRQRTRFRVRDYLLRHNVCFFNVSFYLSFVRLKRDIHLKSGTSPSDKNYSSVCVLYNYFIWRILFTYTFMANDISC